MWSVVSARKSIAALAECTFGCMEHVSNETSNETCETSNEMPVCLHSCSSYPGRKRTGIRQQQEAEARPLTAAARVLAHSVHALPSLPSTWGPLTQGPGCKQGRAAHWDVHSECCCPGPRSVQHTAAVCSWGRVACVCVGGGGGGGGVGGGGGGGGHRPSRSAVLHTHFLSHKATTQWRSQPVPSLPPSLHTHTQPPARLKAYLTQLPVPRTPWSHGNHTHVCISP